MKRSKLACRVTPIALVSVAAYAALSLSSKAAPAATYYVAPTGSNSNPGTLEQPFASMAQGQQVAAAGDTVYFRAGTYRFTSSSAADAVVLNKSGGSNNRIKYWAYQNEVPVFDFSGMTAPERITGVRVTASWVHLKGIEMKLVPQNLDKVNNESWGIYNTGSNNIYEMLNLHHNMGPGFFLGEGGNNLILNCDSHRNYDPKSRAGDGENADGFGCHTKTGDTGNVFRGVRAWWNTDDGYDSINAQEACLVENSWAWLNGYLPDTMTEPNRDPTLPPGNGNGFKLGGFGIDGSGSPATPPKHTIRFSLAFLNVFAGFFANYHTGGHFFYNNTGIQNVGADFNMLGLTANTSVLRNNVAYGPSPTASMTGTDAASNSWNLGVQVSAADFQSISTLGLDAPRQADGSLPVLAFMRLLPDSDLIDKGVNVSLPFNGTAPDLGAFESGGAIGVVGGAGGGPMSGGGAAGMGGSGGMSSGAGANGVAGANGGGGATAGGGTAGSAAGSPTAAGSAGFIGSVGTGGASSASGGASVGVAGELGASGGVQAAGSSSTQKEPSPPDEGCGACRVGARKSASGALMGVGVGLLAFALRRRRQRRAARR